MNQQGRAVESRRSLGGVICETLEPRALLSALTQFQTPLYLNLGTVSNLKDVATADLNGDGRADFVGVSGSQLAVVLTFKGGYRAPVIYTQSNGQPMDSVRIANIDGDSDLDVLVQGDNGSTSIESFLNDGTGGLSFNDLSFGNGFFTTVKDWTLADVTGDQRADLVVVSDGAVRGYAGTGSGDFATSPVLEDTMVGTGIIGVLVARVDADGIPDIVLTRTAGDPLVVKFGLGSGAFGAGQSVATGGVPGTGFQGIDTTGNGRVDFFAAVEPAMDRVAVLRNTSAGGVLAVATAQHTELGGGATTSSIAVGDLTEDGKPDIVVGKQQRAWFDLIPFSRATNDFGSGRSQTQISLRERMTATRIADLDGDGRLDLIGMVQRSVIALPNLGNAVFPVTTVISEPGVEVLAKGDPDNDGKDELLPIGAMESSLYAYDIVDGRPRPGAIFVGTHSLDLPVLGAAFGDFNGDGRTDTAVVGRIGSETFVQVMLASPSAMDGYTTLAPVRIAGNTFSVSAVWSGRLNGNPRDDLVVADETNGRVFVLSGKSNGQLSPVPRLLLGVPVYDIEVADMDGDGDNDLVLGTAQGVAILPELGNHQYGAAIVTAVTGGVIGVEVGLYNPGTSVDVAVLTGQGDGELAFLRNITTMPNQPMLRLLPPAFAFVIRSTGTTIALSSADLDGDGITDFMVGSSSGDVVTFMGDGFLGVGASGRYQEDDDNGVSSILPLDVDQDGDLDLVFVSSWNYDEVPAFTILRSFGDGTFMLPNYSNEDLYPRVPTAPEGNNSARVTTADFNNDGLADMAITIDEFMQPSHVIVYLAGPKGMTRFADVEATRLGDGLIDSGDLNGDGLADIVVYSAIEKRFYTILNTGSGFAAPTIAHSQVDYDYRDFLLTDMNGDGRLDLVGLADLPDLVVIMPGIGNGTFRNGVQRTTVDFPGIGGSTKLFAADIDGSGLPDLAVRIFDGAGKLRIVTDPTSIATTMTDLVMSPDRVDAGHLDGDGILDFVVSDGVTAFFLINTSSPGVVSFSTTSIAVPTGMSAQIASIEDFDLDGRNEVLISSDNGLLMYEINAAGVPVSYVPFGLGWEVRRGLHTADVDGDGDLDQIGIAYLLEGSAVSILLNRNAGVSRPSNSAPVTTSIPIWLAPAAPGSQVVITYESFLAQSGYTDPDGDGLRFRIVSAGAGTLAGPGGILAGNTYFRPGTALTWTAPAGPGGGSVVAFRVVAFDGFVETETAIAVRVPMVAPLLMPPPPGDAGGDEGAGWLSFDPLGLAEALGAAEASPWWMGA